MQFDQMESAKSFISIVDTFSKTVHLVDDLKESMECLHWFSMFKPGKGSLTDLCKNQNLTKFFEELTKTGINETTDILLNQPFDQKMLLIHLNSTKNNSSDVEKITAFYEETITNLKISQIGFYFDPSLIDKSFSKEIFFAQLEGVLKIKNPLKIFILRSENKSDQLIHLLLELKENLRPLKLPFYIYH